MKEVNEPTEVDDDIKSVDKPNYLAYQVTNRKGDGRSFWTKIGVGFLHRDGGGLNILLDCHPINGRIRLRARPYAGQVD